MTIHNNLLVVVLFLASTSSVADVAVVVAAKSSVESLSKEEVSDIFLGKSSTFPDGSLATPVEQSYDSSLHGEFHEKVTGKSGARLRAYWSKLVFTGKASPPKEVGDADLVKKFVAADPRLIGYIDKAATDGSVKVVFLP